MNNNSKIWIVILIVVVACVVAYLSFKKDHIEQVVDRQGQEIIVNEVDQDVQ